MVIWSTQTTFLPACMPEVGCLGVYVNGPTCFPIHQPVKAGWKVKYWKKWKIILLMLMKVKKKIVHYGGILLQTFITSASVYTVKLNHFP